MKLTREMCSVVCRGPGGLGFQGEMHAFVAAVLPGMAWRDALEPNAEGQPPDRELAQAVERVCRRTQDAVVGPQASGRPNSSNARSNTRNANQNHSPAGTL